jgi:hypothetical protein
MYQLGKRPKNRRRKWIWLFVFLLFLAIVAAAVFIISQMANNSTTIVQSPSVTQVVSDDEPTNHYNEGLFSLDLPSNWKFTQHTRNSLYDIYTWQSQGEAANRQLDIYADTIPEKYKVNKILPVKSSDDGINMAGQISNNCTSFVHPTAVEKNAGVVAATYQGVRFLCDIGNPLRNVVGTGSVVSLNSISVTGKTQGAHNFFFVFTDRTITPKYDGLYKAIQTFTVK